MELEVPNENKVERNRLDVVGLFRSLKFSNMIVKGWVRGRHGQKMVVKSYFQQPLLGCGLHGVNWVVLRQRSLKETREIETYVKFKSSFKLKKKYEQNIQIALNNKTHACNLMYNKLK